LRINKSYFLLSLIVALWTYGAPAYAKTKIKSLNEANITKFVEETTALTNGRTGDLSRDDIQEYLTNHLHKQSRFISKITYIIPGFPPQDSVISLGKDEFMATIAEGSDAVEEYENTVEVTSIDISKDQRKATVLTHGTEQGMMEVQPGQSVPIIGTSNCTQILMLSKNDILQMFNAKCETSIEFTGF